MTLCADEGIIFVVWIIGFIVIQIRIFRKEVINMKKIMKVLSTAALAAVVTVTASTAAFAAGINAAEQSILDELSTTVTMNGVVKSIPAQYINQAENYFNTVEITEEQASTAVAAIEDAKAYLASTGVSAYADLTPEQVSAFTDKVQNALTPLGLTLQYTSASSIAIVDANGNTVASSITGGSSSNGGSSNGTTGGTAGGSTVTDNPIKTTGADFNIPGIAVVAGVGIVLVSAAGVYVLKTTKSKDGAQA